MRAVCAARVDAGAVCVDASNARRATRRAGRANMSRARECAAIAIARFSHDDCVVEGGTCERRHSATRDAARRRRAWRITPNKGGLYRHRRRCVACVGVEARAREIEARERRLRCVARRVLEEFRRARTRDAVHESDDD